MNGGASNNQNRTINNEKIKTIFYFFNPFFISRHTNAT